MMDAITAAHDGDIHKIDSTSVRAHQQAATAKRGADTVSVAHAAASRPRSRSSSMRGGSRPGSGRPPVKRTMARSPTSYSTISCHAPSCLPKASDADRIPSLIEEQGATPNIPAKSNR